jgi:hypothetical protein
MIDFTNKIDWDLFKRQKEYLVAMTDDKDRLTEEVTILDGVIALMDAVQDSFQPYGIDEGEAK